MRTHHHTFAAKIITLTMAALVSTAGAVHAADLVALSGKLSGVNEIPANTSSGQGTAEVTLDKDTNQLKWKVVYSDISGPVGAGHFHGPATADKNAGVALGFKGAMESPITGEATITPEQAKDLLAGKWYVNLHTKANPAGEIRAQVMPN